MPNQMFLPNYIITSTTARDQVSYDHRSYERNFKQLRIQKPEKVRTSTGFEPVTSRPVRRSNHAKSCDFHNCDDHSLLDFKSAVQHMKYFIYHFTSILHGLIRTQK